jgi:hypothetical protein
MSTKTKRPRFKLIRVQQVHPLDNYRAHFVFTDGSERDIDLEQYLQGPVFSFVRNDPKVFRNMYVEAGTINWPGEVDIDPDTLYYGDEDPPWVTWDKEQKRKAKLAKRSAPQRTKSANGKSPSSGRTQRTGAKAKPQRKLQAKSTASRKKVLAKGN